MPAPKPRLKVLIAGSECAPFIKTGGLADVMAALPKALAAFDVDVRVICPKYSAISGAYKAQMRHLCDFEVPMGWRRQYCGIETLEQDGVTFYFVDNEFYFDRPYIYNKACDDEAERFSFFSKAVLDCLPHIGFWPDILHCNDWQAAMSLVLLKMQYGLLEGYSAIHTMFTIHNLRYQGVFDWPYVDRLLGLGPDCFSQDRLEYFGKVNFLKGGIVFADRLTTVSPSYAQEIQSSAYGETLDGILRLRGQVDGILNGLDEGLYNPETDISLIARFSAQDRTNKAACSADLQQKLGLEQDPTMPIIGLVSRLTDQKGIDLIERAIIPLLERRIQLAVLGSGDTRYEQLFSWANWRWPGRVGVHFAYNEALARQIYAGSALFLMPSQFEPCGLAQMIALRYGSIPVIRETGGLKDTIRPYNQYTGEGNGFSFGRYDSWDMIDALDRALKLYYDYPEAWQALIQSAMQTHFTWQKSAKEYLRLYQEMVG
jgi:starch synthase